MNYAPKLIILTVGSFLIVSPCVRGDLTNAPNDSKPSFLIRAVKDPDGANLDRVQVIKGWRSADGKLHEKVYDVAVSDGRVIPADGGKVAPVGSTVDLEGPCYTSRLTRKS